MSPTSASQPPVNENTDPPQDISPQRQMRLPPPPLPASEPSQPLIVPAEREASEVQTQTVPASPHKRASPRASFASEAFVSRGSGDLVRQLSDYETLFTPSHRSESDLTRLGVLVSVFAARHEVRKLLGEMEALFLEVVQMSRCEDGLVAHDRLKDYAQKIKQTLKLCHISAQSVLHPKGTLRRSWPSDGTIQGYENFVAEFGAEVSRHFADEQSVVMKSHDRKKVAGHPQSRFKTLLRPGTFFRRGKKSPGHEQVSDIHRLMIVGESVPLLPILAEPGKKLAAFKGRKIIEEAIFDLDAMPTIIFTMHPEDAFHKSPQGGKEGGGTTDKNAKADKNAKGKKKQTPPPHAAGQQKEAGLFPPPGGYGAPPPKRQASDHDPTDDYPDDNAGKRKRRASVAAKPPRVKESQKVMEEDTRPPPASRSSLLRVTHGLSLPCDIELSFRPSGGIVNLLQLPTVEEQFEIVEMLLRLYWLLEVTLNNPIVHRTRYMYQAASDAFEIIDSKMMKNENFGHVSGKQYDCWYNVFPDNTAVAYIEGLLDVRPFELLSLVNECDTHKHWVPMLTSSEEVFSLGLFSRVIQHTVTLPWPLSSRETLLVAFAIDTLNDKDRAAFVMTGSSVPDNTASIWGNQIEPYNKSKTTRMEIRYFTFIVTPLKSTPEKTSLQMLVSFDPKFNFIPASIQGYVARVSAATLWANVKEMCSKYKGSQCEKSVTENPIIYGTIRSRLDDFYARP